MHDRYILNKQPHTNYTNLRRIWYSWGSQVNRRTRTDSKPVPQPAQHLVERSIKCLLSQSVTSSVHMFPSPLIICKKRLHICVPSSLLPSSWSWAYAYATLLAKCLMPAMPGPKKCHVVSWYRTTHGIDFCAGRHFMNNVDHKRRGGRQPQIMRVSEYLDGTKKMYIFTDRGRYVFTLYYSP